MKFPNLPNKFIIFETEMLIKPMLGIYLVITYYNDGTKEEREVPKGKLIILDSLLFT